MKEYLKKLFFNKYILDLKLVQITEEIMHFHRPKNFFLSVLPLVRCLVWPWAPEPAWWSNKRSPQRAWRAERLPSAAPSASFCKLVYSLQY